MPQIAIYSDIFILWSMISIIRIEINFFFSSEFKSTNLHVKENRLMHNVYILLLNTCALLAGLDVVNRVFYGDFRGLVVEGLT